MNCFKDFFGTVFLALLLLTPLEATAIALNIIPSTIDSSAPVERALRENKGHASTSIQGQGAYLELTYRSDQAIEVYMAPITSEGRFIPGDFLTFTLPATDDGTARIDLSTSRGWVPFNAKWLLHFLTKDDEAHTGFRSIALVQGAPLKTVTSLVKNSLRQEPYTPSSYHALHGYRALSTDLTIIAGFVLLLTCLCMYVLRKKEKKLESIIITLILFQAVYGLRFGIDLLKFTSDHVMGKTQGIYDEAGSVYEIASSIRTLSEKNLTKKTDTIVYVCRSGTNYKEKILRYFAYPIQISSESGDAKKANFGLVMNAREWHLEGQNKGNIILNCNDLRRKAAQLEEFPDGSILFSLQQ